MERRYNETPRAANLGGVGGLGIVTSGKARSLCGRCGREVSARTRDKGVRYCHDCQTTDPVFCGRA